MVSVGSGVQVGIWERVVVNRQWSLGRASADVGGTT
jgi:hypothetical protein